MSMNAHNDVSKQYVSVSRSANLACASSFPRCRIGIVGYIFTKKKSMHCATISFVNNPGVGASVGAHCGGLAYAFPASRRACALEERADWRFCSRSSEMTFAREPLGPFFCGIALYVHASWAEEQLRHGERPSHFTFRRWQASQARLTDVEVVVVVVVVAVVEGAGGGGADEEVDDEPDDEDGVVDDMFRRAIASDEVVIEGKRRRTGRGNVVSSPMRIQVGEDCGGEEERVDVKFAVGERK